MAYTVQYVHSGSAVETYLAVDCTTGSVAITLNDATGWPSPTASQVAYGKIKPGQTGESAFTYTSRSGNVLSGVTWNADGTTSTSYTAGSATVIRHGFTANEADEANAAVRNTLGRVTAIGDILVADSTTTLAKLAKGSAYQNLGMNSAGTTLGYQASLQSLLTASGDIPYASAANTPARLAKGSDGQVLTLAAGLPSWAAAGGAFGTLSVSQGKLSAAQNITTSTETALLFDLEDYDTAAQHSIVSNTDQWVIAATGDYEISGKVTWGIASAGIITDNYLKIGAAYLMEVRAVSTTSGHEAVFPTITVALTIGDVIRMAGWHNFGSTTTVHSETQGKHKTFIRIKRVS